MLLILILSCCVQSLVYFSFLLDMKSVNQSVITVCYWIPDFGITLNLFTWLSEHTITHPIMKTTHTEEIILTTPHPLCQSVSLLYCQTNRVSSTLVALLHVTDQWVLVARNKDKKREHNNHPVNYSYICPNWKLLASLSSWKPGPGQYEKHHSHRCVFICAIQPLVACIIHSTRTNLVIPYLIISIIMIQVLFKETQALLVYHDYIHHAPEGTTSFLLVPVMVNLLFHPLGSLWCYRAMYNVPYLDSKLKAALHVITTIYVNTMWFSWG